MKLFIVSVLVAVASAKPSGIAAPLAISAPAAVVAPVAVAAPVSTQYHTQDELGQYSYGYSNVHSAKTEARSADGLTVGGYTYVDPAGKLQSVEYSSDGNGFRVAASSLPVAPALPAVPALPLPVPVQDTPEVVEARAKHLEILEAAKVQAEVSASVPAVSTVVHSVAPLATASLVATPLAAFGALPTPLITPSSAVVAPVLATKSGKEVLSEEDQSSAASSTEAPTTPAATEAPSTLTPAAEGRSIVSTSLLTPAGVSILSAPTIGLKSLVAPALNIASFTPATTYSIHPYGFSSLVAHPGVTAYSAQFLAPVPGVAVQNNEAKPAE